MRLALGMTVHTGWATAALVGGGWTAPVVVARERLELLGAEARFVFHKAAELAPRDAARSVERAKHEAFACAMDGMKRLRAATGSHDASLSERGPGGRRLVDTIL